MNSSNTSRRQLKTSYRASPRSLQPVYTGGPVLITRDGLWVISTMEEEVLVTEISTGLRIARIKGDTTAVTSLSLSYHTSPPTLITCHMSMMIRYYPLPTSPPLGSTPPYLSYTRALPKAHSAPILVSTTSPDDTLLATGSSDGVVKVWDLEGGYVTHMFRGHGGPVSAAQFHFSSDGDKRMELFTGSTDARVRIFDLKDPSARAVGGGNAAKPKAVLEGHVSTIRGIDVTEDGRWAVTAGRDKVVLVWDLSGGGDSAASNKKGKSKAKEAIQPKLVQTIICEEQVESLGLLPMDQPVVGATGSRIRCWTGGDKGLVRIWDVLKAELVGSMRGVEGVDEVEAEEDEQRGIIQILYDANTSSLVSIHADQNIIFHSLASGEPSRQIVGFNDEIIDATFLSTASSSSHTHLALATNSNLIRLYSTTTFDVRLLSGHKDMVLSLDKSIDYRWLASGSKDHTARIWSSTDNGDWRCLAVCEGHAEAVGGVALSRKMDDKGKSGRFLMTASQDRTIKMWDLTSLPLDEIPDQPLKPRSLATIRAHEKDINALDLAPNDRFLASGSQDKLVKIYEVDFNPGQGGAVRHVGTCKGHKRGVWTVKFSRTDRIVASGAADRTIRIWSLDDYSCLKTFEGHTNSVLRLDFLSAGMQLVTSSSDGLVKLWNIKDEECVKTLDNHEDKIWAIAVSNDEKTIVSAGADSVATFWQDSTEAEQDEKNDALIKAVQSEQDFTNYLSLKDYRRAIKLALAMSQPGRLLHLFTAVSAEPTSLTAITGSDEVDQVIATLTGTDLVRLLKFVRDWNTNARTSSVAQMILHAILKMRTPEDLLAAFESKAPEDLNAGMDVDDEDKEEAEDQEQKPKSREQQLSFKDLLDGLVPYSQRHFTRIDKLVQDSYMLDYIVGEMDGGLFGGEVIDTDPISAQGNGHSNGDVEMIGA